MEELKNKILSGEIRPGEKLPSENELAQEYGISRHTVRKALAILANDGYITTEHGKGTFCSDRMAHRNNSKNIAVITTYISDYIFPRSVLFHLPLLISAYIPTPLFHQCIADII